MPLAGGQDLLAQHGNPNGPEMNGSLRLASRLNGQPAAATLTISNDHLLPQSPANGGMAGQDFLEPREASRRELTRVFGSAVALFLCGFDDWFSQSNLLHGSDTDHQYRFPFRHLKQ